MKDELTDRSEMLAVCTREGSNEAFETLVVMYGPLIQKTIAPYRCRFSYDELYAEACGALHEAALHWRADGGAHFGRFASVCIENRLKSFARKNTSHAEASFYEDVLAPGDMERELVHREDAARIRFIIRHFASDLEYRVCMLYLNGYAPREIALRLHMKTKDVTNAEARLKRKLRDKADLFEEFL